MHSTELYLVLETDEKHAGHAAECLRAALEAAHITSLLIAPASEQPLAAHAVKPLVELAQRAGVAAMIANEADLARLLRADGVHLAWAKDQTERHKAARETLGSRALLGADAGRSRDEAMTLGEAGADYVAFGIPPHVEDRQTAFERQIELIDWWSQLFEIPSVAFDVATADHARALAEAGADFVAVKIDVTADDPEMTRERVRAFADAINVARERV